MINEWLVLNALRDGKIVRMYDTNWDNNRVFKMEIDEDENETLVERCRKDWIPAAIDFNKLFTADCEIIEDYDLTFEEAIRAALDGKIIISECRPSYKIKFDKKFLICGAYGEVWTNCAIFTTFEQEGMWRVYRMTYEYLEEQRTFTVSIEAGFLIETKEPVKESRIIEELTGLRFCDMGLTIKEITGVYKCFDNGWVIYARVEIDLEAGEGDTAIEHAINNLEQLSTDFEVDKSTWYIETRFVEEDTAEIVNEEAF